MRCKKGGRRRKRRKEAKKETAKGNSREFGLVKFQERKKGGLRKKKGHGRSGKNVTTTGRGEKRNQSQKIPGRTALKSSKIVLEGKT